ncbi:hypothetical protein CesoFtcFv8_004574 [Champsocephalus esox]|uniref:Uncharacterized protein n=1 Tax=Champsocephalus esox TaxID=159716 RepID=A0AAN8H8G6_9TELE|nr:hypothetical protein CesoFtcFv8_004574 [Champsocephalus esox]
MAGLEARRTFTETEPGCVCLPDQRASSNPSTLLHQTSTLCACTYYDHCELVFRVVFTAFEKPTQRMLSFHVLEKS